MLKKCRNIFCNFRNIFLEIWLEDCRRVPPIKREFLENPFFSEHFRKGIYGRFFIKRELQFILFFRCLLKFLLREFQNTLMKTSIIEFTVLLGCRFQYCVSTKKWPHQRHFFETFRDNIIPPKNVGLWWIPILTTCYNISQNKFIYKCCTSGYYEKIPITSLQSQADGARCFYMKQKSFTGKESSYRKGLDFVLQTFSCIA